MSLVIRGSNYHFRRRIPKDVAAKIGLNEVCRSLGTNNRANAWVRAAVYERKFEEACRMAREGNINSLTRDDVENIIRLFRSRRLFDMEETFVDPISELSEEALEVTQDYAVDDARRAENDLLYNQQDKVDKEARELLKEMGFKRSAHSYEYKLLRYRLLETRKELALVYFNALRGDTEGLRAGLAGGGAGGQQAATVKSKPKLSVLIEEYKELKVAAKDWREKTIRENTQKLRVMVEFFGDRPIDMISKQHANKFFTLLTELPTDFARQMDKTSLKQLASRNKKNNGKTLEEKTIYDKYISAVKSFFKWAAANDYIVKSPFEHMRAAAKAKGARGERDLLDTADLEIAFGDDYTLDSVPHASHFWMPHIMMYTGARPAEIGQLLVSDIVDNKGVWCININDEGLSGKSLKNSNSIRVVPIHPALIQAGFIDHVETLRREGALQLWPNLEQGINGYGNAVQKWFNRSRLKNKNITGKKKVLYSLRHTFITGMLDKEVPLNIVEQIVGHASQSMSSKRYDKGRQMEQLLSHMVKLDVPLSHGLKLLIEARNQSQHHPHSDH